MEKKLENITIFIEKGVLDGYSFTGLEIKIKEIVETEKEQFKFSFETQEPESFKGTKTTIEEPPYEALKKLIKEDRVSVTFKKSEEGNTKIIRPVIGFLYYKKEKELYFLTSLISIDQRSIVDEAHETSFFKLNTNTETYLKVGFNKSMEQKLIKFTHTENCNIITK